MDLVWAVGGRGPVLRRPVLRGGFTVVDVGVGRVRVHARVGARTARGLRGGILGLHGRVGVERERVPRPRSASWSRRMSSRSPYGATWPWHSWPRRASRGASPRPRPSQPSPPSDPSRRCARDEPSRSAGPSRDTPAPRAPKCNREPIPRRTREHPAKLHTRVRESRQAPRGVTRERDDDRLSPRGARRRPHRQISRVHRAHRSRRTDRDARASVSTSETKKNSGPRGGCENRETQIRRRERERIPQWDASLLIFENVRPGSNIH